MQGIEGWGNGDSVSRKESSLKTKEEVQRVALRGPRATSNTKAPKWKLKAGNEGHKRRLGETRTIYGGQRLQHFESGTGQHRSKDTFVAAPSPYPAGTRTVWPNPHRPGVSFPSRPVVFVRRSKLERMKLVPRRPIIARDHSIRQKSRFTVQIGLSAARRFCRRTRDLNFHSLPMVPRDGLPAGSCLRRRRRHPRGNG